MLLVIMIMFMLILTLMAMLFNGDVYHFYVDADDNLDAGVGI